MTTIVTHNGETFGVRRVTEGALTGATFVAFPDGRGFYFRRSVADTIEDVKWNIDHKAWIFGEAK
jgi:hypothetical protein